MPMPKKIIIIKKSRCNILSQFKLVEDIYRSVC